MISFFKEVRADECPLDEERDALLFQWGVYDWGEGEQFEYNITRQFVFIEDSDDSEEWKEEAIWQLSLTLKSFPNDPMKSIESGNKWCSSLNEIDAFKEFIESNKATEEIKNTKSYMVEFYYEQV
jgi:hypothetical protein